MPGHGNHWESIYSIEEYVDVALSCLERLASVEEIRFVVTDDGMLTLFESWLSRYSERHWKAEIS